METNCSEKEILSRLVQGDEGVFALLYEQYHHAIYLNVIKLIHAPVEAEDVVQEVFLTLWRKRESIDSNRSIGGWLFTVSYHLSLDFLRKKLREHRYEQMSTMMDIDNVEEELPEFQINILEEAIRHLSPQKRRVFQLCKLEGKSYEQASIELGISKYTINEYLKDGMTFIRQYVKANPIFNLLVTVFALESISYVILSFC